MQGIGSDPVKSMEYRATARLLGQCIQTGQYHIQNSQYSIKCYITCICHVHFTLLEHHLRNEANQHIF